MGINFHATYGFLLLGLIEIYIGVFLFMTSFLLDKHELRKNKMDEVKMFFGKLHLLKKILIFSAFILFILSLMILILYLDLPEGQSLKDNLTWPLVILGACTFSYNSLIDSKKAEDSANKSMVINHLIINKAFYKNLIGAIFCGIFIIVGIRTLVAN